MAGEENSPFEKVATSGTKGDTDYATSCGVTRTASTTHTVIGKITTGNTLRGETFANPAYDGLSHGADAN